MEKKKFLQKVVRSGLAFCLLFAATWYVSGQLKVQASERVVKATNETPRLGGTLKIGINTDAVYLGYPPDSRRYYDLIISRPCVETLGRTDTTGKLIPWLATSWKMDSKAKTVILTLRKGVKFHDGTAFNAEAVKWNLDQFSTAGRDELKIVTSVDIVDNYTVRLNLASFDNTIMNSILGNAGPMISPTAFKNHGKDWCATHPVGTGPFEFVSWERDTVVKYKKFDGYWQKGKPYLDGVEFRIIKDPMTASAALLAREIDVNASPSPSDVKGLPASYNIVKLTTGLGVTLIGLMGDSVHSNSPFANVKVRQAIGYAVDRRAIVDTIFSGFGIPTPQWGLSTNWSYNPKLKGFPYDPAKAKQLLAEAGYPNGFKTKLIGQNNADNVNMMTAVQGYLAKIGIDVQVDPADGGRYSAATVAPQGWEGLIASSDRCDADNLYQMRRVIGSAGTLFAKGLTHPQKIDELIAKAAATPDIKIKTALTHQVQQVVFEEYSIFTPLFVSVWFAVKHPSVHDDGIYVTEGSLWTPENAWIEK